MIALDDGITPDISCVCINDAIDCDTVQYWMFQVNEGDEIYSMSTRLLRAIMTWLIGPSMMGSKGNLIQHRITPLAGEKMSRPSLSLPQLEPTAFVCIMNLGLSISILWPFK